MKTSRFFQKLTNVPPVLAGLITLLAIGLHALPAMSQATNQANVFVERAGGSYEQIEVVLQADHAPAPDGVVAFTFTAKPLRNAPDLTVTWELPDGGALLGGPAQESLGAVAAGASVQQTRQVHFADEGVFAVNVRATYRPNSATTLNVLAVLFFTIRADGSSVSDIDPRIPLYQPPPFKPTIDKSDKVVAAGTISPNAPAGCLSIVGRLMREDRQPVASPPGYNNVTGQANALPVHNVLVEMREEDTFSDDSYGYTVTDPNGFFTFNFCDGDGFLNDELELYYRVCSEVWDGPRIARIEKNSDEELYCWDSGTIDKEEGDVNFGTRLYLLSETESQVFNIADSLYWASTYWNNNLGQGAPRMDRTVRIRWEPGKTNGGSRYSAARGVLYLGGDASSTDEWDESVIIHEWGHFSDQQFSCFKDPGGSHSLPGLNVGPNGNQLAWGEGYADYYQSAVRTIIPGSGPPNFYIDPSGPTVDLETPGATADPRDEGAVAGLLWDFLDTANDTSDTVTHGQARIEATFTNPGFQGTPQCNMNQFLTVWKNLGFPTDAVTAATVVQNVNIAKPFGVSVASAAPLLTVAETGAVNAINAASPLGYRWWDQVTMVVDNSSSMADPAGTPKIDAVKTLIKEQISDMEKNPRGTEFDIYNFNAASADPSTVLEGGFFGKQINPVLDGLQANGADSGCPVNSLYALSQAVQNKYDGQAWLYTDGDALPYTSVNYIQAQLNNRLVRGSVVLLGGCSSPPTEERSITGPEQDFLGLAADGLESTGIVPYLLTAIGTGGSFLFVAPDQLANATDILRAQASHSAGAGGWSDYVSNDYTYRWERLPSWEYNWITPVNRKGQSVPSSLEIAGLPTMTVYGTPYNKVQVARDGTISMGDPVVPGNSLGRDLDVLLNLDMNWYYNSNPNLAAADRPDAPDAGYVQDVYADEVGDWVVFTVSGQADDASHSPRAYQALVNKITGEIRYQYQAVAPGDSDNALIGVSQSDFATGFSEEVYASVNDVNGAVPGKGYRFINAPPQPSKSYSVSVDSKMSGVGFLLTGYSGYLNAMSLVDPNGTAVDCTDTANVLCLTLSGGLVQYVQVNVNGNGGVYVATVSGQGTFSFNAMAASAIRATGLGRRTLSLDQQILQVDFGQSADNGLLSGWLQTPAGARFGSPLSFFDDGGHGDGESGDGIFGSDGFTPPGRGVAYLWVQGAVDGEAIVRSDPTPYNFQPIIVQPEPDYVQGFVGSSIAPGFAVTNQDVVRHCYSWEVKVPEGFVFDGASPPFCVDPGETGHPNATFHYPMSDISGGVTAQMGADFFETEQGSIIGSATTTVAMFRPLAGVEIENPHQAEYLRPNSTDSVTMSVNLLDDQGRLSGWSGNLGIAGPAVTPPELGTATAPTAGVFENGRMPVLFTSAAQTGEALITINVEGLVATTTLQIRNPSAAKLDLVATPTDLSGKQSTEAALVVTLLDAWGDPVVGQLVRLNVSDDTDSEGSGSINGGEVFTATTDANGQVQTTFVKGKKPQEKVAVRAESLVQEGDGWRVTHEDVEILSFIDGPVLAITSKPRLAAVINKLYQYQITATGLSPTFDLLQKPDGMTIDAATGMIRWTPTALGSYSVTVRAANGVNPDVEQTFTIKVTAAEVPGQELFIPRVQR